MSNQCNSVLIDGSKIYYEVAGSGEPMIFIHGDTLDTRQWDEQFEYFSKKYQVIRYDIRGMGKSGLPSDEPYSFSEDLDKLMVALSVDKAHLVGLSLGGAIAIDFALTHSDKVLSLTLADAGIAGDGFKQEFKDSIGHIIDLAKAQKLDEVRKTWSALSIFDTSRSNPEVWQKITLMVNDTSCYRWYGSNQPVDVIPKSATRLSNIKVPTLILVGENDIEDFQRKAILLNSQVSNSQLITIPRAGHLSNLDNPTAFNQALEKFLEQ